MGKRRFMGGVEAHEGNEVSRLSNKRVVAFVRGWDVGVQVTAYVDMQGNDRIGIWTTNGSNDPHQKNFVADIDHNGVIHASSDA